MVFPADVALRFDETPGQTEVGEAVTEVGAGIEHTCCRVVVLQLD